MHKNLRFCANKQTKITFVVLLASPWSTKETTMLCVIACLFVSNKIKNSDFDYCFPLGGGWMSTPHLYNTYSTLKLTMHSSLYLELLNVEESGLLL